MANIIDAFYNFKNFFNSQSIPFVVGCGYGIELLCEKYYIKPIFEVKNLDIFYIANTPITPENIGNYKRRQTSPCSSLTYVNEEGFEVNITMCRIQYMRFIEYNEIKIMHPARIMTYYSDNFVQNETNDLKLFVLQNIIESIKMEPIKSINKYNIVQVEKSIHEQSIRNIESCRKRLFNHTNSLPILSE